jgi:hypothetical protein
VSPEHYRYGTDTDTDGTVTVGMCADCAEQPVDFGGTTCASCLRERWQRVLWGGQAAVGVRRSLGP